MRKVRWRHFRTASTVSRVVPGVSLTIDRSSWSSRLRSDDFPTLGRPTMATAVSSGSDGRVPPGRQPLDDLVEQVAHALAVLGRHLDDRLEPELVELDRAAAGPLVVGLVDRHQDRDGGRSEPRGNLLVPRNEPLASIYNKNNDVGRFERAPAGQDDELVQRIGAGAEHAARIDQREDNSLPLSRLRDHVAGRPGDGGDDGPPGVRDPVEERGLSDVGTADQHDGRPFRGAFQWHADVYLAPRLTA